MKTKAAAQLTKCETTNGLGDNSVTTEKGADRSARGVRYINGHCDQN